MLATPALSVCIPTHDGRCAVLEEALESIAAQIGDDLAPVVEIVVSDNASRDGTEAMIARLRERHPAIALVYARNDRDVRLENILRVVGRASGEWCWLFGSDDVMAEDGLRTVLAAIDRHPDVSGIAVSKGNFSYDMRAALGQDPPTCRPAAVHETVYERFGEIVHELAYQLGYLSSNVVRRARWTAAAAAVGPGVFLRHPDWPHLVILAEMARRDPAWAWLPDVLVKARAGRPYLTDASAAETNLAAVHVALADGFRDVWPEVAGRGTPLHRALLRKSYAVATADVVRNIKLQDGQTLGRDVALLVSFTRAFWRVPEFRRESLAPLLVPARASRFLRRVRPTRAMTALSPEQCATEVRVTLPAVLRARETLRVSCVVTNRGPRALRRADPHPVALGFRWFAAAGGAAVSDGDRAQLARPLRPGASLTIDCDVAAPWEPGDYELRIAPVQELVAWFDDLDPANGVRLPVRLELQRA